MDLSKNELDSYIVSIKTNVKAKMRYIIETAANEVDLKKLGIALTEKSWKEHWGRSGVEFYFKPKQNLGQWFFLGIYYDKSDHGIPFKQDNEPELAFFFDIEPSNRDKLKQNQSFVESLINLNKLGFEENLTKVITSNQWRLIFKREPLSKIDKFTIDELKKYLEGILHDLLSESYFAELLKSE